MRYTKDAAVIEVPCDNENPLTIFVNMAHAHFLGILSVQQSRKTPSFSAAVLDDETRLVLV